MELNELKKGMRVELHPATDAWMRGDRYGTVVFVKRDGAEVQMDRSGRLRHVDAKNILREV